MKRLVPYLLVGLIVITLGGPANSDPPQVSNSDKSNLPPLMQMKLEKSKLILDGLTLEEFEKIGKSARSLRLLST